MKVKVVDAGLGVSSSSFLHATSLDSLYSYLKYSSALIVDPGVLNMQASDRSRSTFVRRDV
jgi:hypothetical protein